MTNKINLSGDTLWKCCKMVAAVSVLAASAIPLSVSAQVPPREGVVSQRDEEKPRTHRFFDRNNSIGFSMMFAARAFDAHSTCRNLASGGREYIIPSQKCDVITGTLLSGGGAIVLLSYVAHRWGKHKLERWMPRVSAISGGILATWNYTDH